MSKKQEEKTWKVNEIVIKSLPTPMVVIDSRYKLLIVNQGFKNVFSPYKKNILQIYSSYIY